MVNISFIDKVNQRYNYLLENSSVITLNALRRLINYNLEIYAIEDVDFYNNDSVIIDEMLANRIGLCPISTPLDNTGKKVTFALDKTGPCTVYSGDFVSNDSEVKMVYENIPLTKLNDNKQLKLEAFAVLGQGREHFKYAPAIVSYKQLSDLKVDSKCSSCWTCVNVCPQGCLEKGTKKPVLKNRNLCQGCRSCIDACPNDCLSLENTNDFILKVEIIGQIDIKTVFNMLERYTKNYFSIIKKRLK